jgi:HPt (histidine-containing phosphotransfer) domain-containing protein
VCSPMTFIATTQSQPPCCNPAKAILKLDGDVELLHALAKLFLATLPDRLAELHGGMAEGCAQKISDAAHSIKGSVRYFEADATYDAAQLLEIASTSGQREAIESACQLLLREIKRLQHELPALISQTAHQPEFEPLFK